MALTNKQKIFVREYLIDKNASRAARKAGFGRSPGSARKIGHQLVTKLDREIQAGLAKQAKSADITAEKILDRIAQVGFKRKAAANKDILKAMELLGRRFGLWIDVEEHRGAVTLITASDEQVDAAAQKVIEGA